MTKGDTIVYVVEDDAPLRASLTNLLRSVGPQVAAFASAQAFQSLVHQLLSKNDAELARWRSALLEALGVNDSLMVNLIPELALAVGEQPPVADLPPQDARNRFQLVFRRFIGVFAHAEHEFALFLDDLQWLDKATLDLIEHLGTHPEVRYLLLVGAYRDNEVGPSHPLIRTLRVIRNAKGRVQEIVLTLLMPAMWNT